jgi:hypothetical protein
MAVVVGSGNHSFLNYLEGPAVRTGIITGVGLSATFAAWLLVANRVPSLEAMAVSRNVVAASLLGLFASIPVLRFVRQPAELLASSVIAWGLFTVTYGGLCLEFPLLDQYYSTFQVFVLGSLIYLLLATLCWIGTIIWRVWATHSSHPRQ